MVHINNTKHITIANIYIPPRDSTSTHHKHTTLRPQRKSQTRVKGVGRLTQQQEDIYHGTLCCIVQHAKKREVKVYTSNNHIY